MHLPKHFIPLLLIPCVSGLLFAACSDDAETEPPAATTTGTTGETSPTGTTGTTTPSETTGTTGTTSTTTGPTTGTTGTTSGPVCEDDDLSPNHSVEDAVRVEVGTSLEDLHICPTIRDYFSIDLEEGDLVSVEILFDNEEGDLDLFILAPGVIDETQALADSLSVDDNEQTAFGAFETGTYTILVAGYQNATTSYALNVAPGCQQDADCAEGVCNRILASCVDEVTPTCGDDTLEPNSTDTRAVVLSRDTPETTYNNLATCDQDLDLWRVSLEDGDSVDVSLETDTDVFMGVFALDDQGVVIAEAAQEGSPIQRLSLPFMPAGEILFLITSIGGPGAAQTNAYDASFTITQGECAENIQCAPTGDRLFCEDGVCTAIDGQNMGALGDVCDSPDDCNDDAFGCYVGAQDPSSNLCTLSCRDDVDCAEIPNTTCLTDVGVCAKGCETDIQCTTRQFCNDEGTCASRECSQDDDCTQEGQQCVYDQAGFGLTGICQTYTVPSCGHTNPEEPNDTTSLATPIELGDDNTARVSSQQICPADIDIYSIDIPEAGTLTLELLFGGPTNLDVFLIRDGVQRPYAVGTSRAEDNETAVAEFISPGRYFIQVIQYPGDRPETFYSLDVSFEAGGCESAASCLSTSALRLVCEDEGCENFQGNGEVALGGLCDSLDDCTLDANFCFALSAAAQRAANICTIECDNDTDCADIAGTSCQPTPIAFFCLP